MTRQRDDGTSDDAVGTGTGVSRRRLLAISGASALSALAGCGSSSDSEGTATPPVGTATDEPAEPTTSEPTEAPPSTATETATSAPRTTPGSGGGFDAGSLRKSPSSRFAPSDGFASVDWLDGAEPDVVRVTNLDASGEGSLPWALEYAGPRVVVFEVGGVVDLRGENVSIGSGNVFVAGQTAPSPGITVIRGGLTTSASNVIVQHLRVRPGDELTDGEIDGNPSGRATDALSADDDSENVVFDHCSVSWGSDENMSASGGKSTTAVTFSNNINAECLSESPLHPEAEHAKGTLVNDYVTDVAVVGNLYVHNTDRHPRIKGGATAASVNNFVYNFAEAVEMGGGPNEPALGSIVGNYYRAGPITDTDHPLIVAEGQAGARAYVANNVSQPSMPDHEGDLSVMSMKYVWPNGLVASDAADVPAHNFATVGARPADRTRHDERHVTDARTGSGNRIDSQAEVGGYPDLDSTRRPLDPPAADELGAWIYEHTKAVERSDYSLD